MSALALVATIAACGSSKSKSSSGTTAASGTTGGSGSGSNSTPIKVGMMCDCSGTVGPILEPQSLVYKAWVNSVNASGGINGHKIDLTVEDDGSQPATAAADAKTLISDHVDAIVTISVFSATWAADAQAAGIPVVGSNASEDEFYQNPDFYDEAQTADSETAAVVATAKAAGAKTMAMFYCAEAPSCQELVASTKALAQKAGVPVVDTSSIALNAPNYTAQCVAAQQSHANAIMDFTTSAPLLRIGSDCNRQGYNPIYVTEGQGFFPTLLTGAGVKDSLWSEYNDYPYWGTIPSIKDMDAAVDKYYPGLRSNVNEWSQGTAEAWPSGLLLEDGLKAGGLTANNAPSPQMITKGLESLKGDTLQGWAPPLTYPAGKGHSIGCWFEARLVNGTPQLTNGGRVACASQSS